MVIEADKAIHTDKFKQDSIAVVSATAGSALTFQAGKKIIGIPMKEMQNNMFKEALAVNSIFKDSAIKVLKDNNIKYSNFASPLDFILDDDVIEFMKKKNKQPLAKFINKLKKIKNKILPKFITKIKDKNILKKMNAYASGTNACCLGDKIFVNFDKISIAAFHEAGHAKNYTSKFGKLLKNLRSPIISKSLLGIAFASAILLPSKTKEEKTDLERNGNLLDKGLNFAKENYMGFALAGTLPTVLEEGLATYKGNTMAKDVLSNENFKKLKMLNRKALLSYGVKAALILCTVFVANKIRNSFNDQSVARSGFNPTE